MSASKAKRTNYGKSVSHTKLAVVAQRGIDAALSQARQMTSAHLMNRRCDCMQHLKRSNQNGLSHEVCDRAGREGAVGENRCFLHRQARHARESLPEIQANV